MNERAKITASHLASQAIVYLRQSSAAQVEHNRESTDPEDALAAKARELGWPNDRIIVIDEHLGRSGSGFRLARNNADWHRLIVLRSSARIAKIPRQATASSLMTGSAKRTF
ncbi:recombinase family protein [Bradyrhizobium sp. RT11b]|uniref:recombinase family protein n=1 Tax=Bradyrhizobium sp. RT11b TaxID=3156332 RepID=UPI00339A612C